MARRLAWRLDVGLTSDVFFLRQSIISTQYVELQILLYASYHEIISPDVLWIDMK